MASLRSMAVLVILMATVVFSYPYGKEQEFNKWIRELRSQETCAGKSYDSDFYMCCDGVINWKGAGKTSLRCCGTVNYDPDFYVCCNEKVLSQGLGKTKCMLSSVVL